jgi:hypothetical protein
MSGGAARRLEARGGVLATYMHACPAPGLGRMAAVVRLESTGARLEGAAARVAQARPALPFGPAVAHAAGRAWTAKRALCFGFPHPQSVCGTGLQTSFVSVWMRDMLAMLTLDLWRPRRRQHRTLLL